MQPTPWLRRGRTTVSRRARHVMACRWLIFLQRPVRQGGQTESGRQIDWACGVAVCLGRGMRVVAMGSAEWVPRDEPEAINRLDRAVRLARGRQTTPRALFQVTCSFAGGPWLGNCSIFEHEAHVDSVCDGNCQWWRGTAGELRQLGPGQQGIASEWVPSVSLAPHRRAVGECCRGAPLGFQLQFQLSGRCRFVFSLPLPPCRPRLSSTTTPKSYNHASAPSTIARSMTRPSTGATLACQRRLNANSLHPQPYDSPIASLTAP